MKIEKIWAVLSASNVEGIAWSLILGSRVIQAIKKHLNESVAKKLIEEGIFFNVVKYIVENDIQFEYNESLQMEGDEERFISQHEGEKYIIAGRKISFEQVFQTMLYCYRHPELQDGLLINYKGDQSSLKAVFSPLECPPEDLNWQEIINHFFNNY